MMIVSLLLLALPAFPAEPLGPGDHYRTLTIGEEVRSYLVHIPPSYNPAKPTPVVLALHSAAMNGSMMSKFTGLNQKSDEAGFVVVYPNGTGTTTMFLYWDAGGVRGRVSDDVGYVSKLIDDLSTMVNVDSRRVFATGMSNGGMMCYRLAAELSNRIAAIAPVSGTMAIDDCRPVRPVPVMHFHGTHDTLVLFNGPDERIPKNLKFLSVNDSVQAWAKINGCPLIPREEPLPDLARDGTTVRRSVYAPGKDGSEVVLYVVEGGGHTWPGRDPRVILLGKSTRDISANDLIWDFFEKHPMRSTPVNLATPGPSARVLGSP